MIDSNGHLHCDKCGKEHLLSLEGKVTWYCPRCHHFNKENTDKILVEGDLVKLTKEDRVI